MTLITPTATPSVACQTYDPAPGVPGGIVGRPEQPRRVVDELEHLALVPDVIAGRQDVNAGA